jgi:hypothetical protein
LIRAGLSRKQAAFTLWTFSAGFAAVALLISSINIAIESYAVTGAALLWVLMFVVFFRTKDS